MTQHMHAPNLFLFYVRDAAAAAAFYSDLFGLSPSFVSPRYIAFDVAPDVLFGVWSGRPDDARPGTPRTAEIGLMVPAEEVTSTYERWRSNGITILEPPYEEPFGLTFVASDPDGNLIRVSPLD